MSPTSSTEDSVDGLAQSLFGVLRKGAKGGGKVKQLERNHHRARMVSVRPASAPHFGKIGHLAVDWPQPPKKDAKRGTGGQKGRRINSVEEVAGEEEAAVEDADVWSANACIS